MEKDIEEALPEFQELVLSLSSVISPPLPAFSNVQTKNKYRAAQRAIRRDAEAPAGLVRRVRSACKTDKTPARAAWGIAGARAECHSDSS